MKFERRNSRRAIAGIVATVIMFAILFTVGTSYFIFIGSENASYVSSLLKATNKVQGTLQESLSVTTTLKSDGDVGFYVNNTSSVTVNMTAVLVISSTGALLKCDGIGFPAGAGCGNSTPSLWAVVNAGDGSGTFDTGYIYVAGTTDTVKVLTARGNNYAASYPEPASQSGSSQSVTVNLDNLRWIQLVPEASSLVQKNYVANCNSQNCALAYSSSVTAGNILVDAEGWANNAPPSGVPTDTRGDLFSLGASSSVAVSASPALVQNKYTSNCNAASCGLAFTSSVTAGHELVYSIGWANQAPPSAPTDTRGDTFALGASQSVTWNPPTPALVQHRYLANCNAATCALAYSSSVTAGNTLVLGLGWPATQPYTYVPVTVSNCQLPISSLALDGYTTAGSGGSATNTQTTGTLTTSHTNDLIVVIASLSDGSGGSTTSNIVSTVTASGLSFAKRAAATNFVSPDYYADVEEWYAVASSTFSGTITVTTTSSDRFTVIAFGISGANTSSPFDSNSGANPTAFGTSNAPSVTQSTSNSNDMLIDGLAVSQTPGAVNSFPTGFTNIANVLTAGSLSEAEGSSDYDQVSSTTSGDAISYDLSSSSNDWAMLADAIVGTSSSCASGPLVDGTNSNECDASTSCTLSVSTSHTNDVIYVSITDSTGGNILSSISDSAGLAWTQRQTISSSGNYDIYTYYAIATSTLSSDTITVNSNPGFHSTTNLRLMEIGAAGANTASPFDPHLTTAPTATGTNAAPSVTFTTTNADDLIIGTVADASHTITAGASGYTTMLCCTTQDSALQYKLVTATGSQTPSFTASGSASWGEIGDAIQAATQSATPATFQQMVTWDPAQYTSYEATNLGNVRFCADDACNSPLYAWLESCSSACSTSGSTSTSATAWVKLTSAISAGGTLTIYMVFEGTGVNFDDNYWGEAPNLSSTYAQYDNGANVFNAYFNGNTATTSFSVYSGYTIAKATGVAGPGGSTINAIKATGYNGNNPVFSFSAALTNAAMIVESSFSGASCSSPGTDTGAVGLVNNVKAASITNAISGNCGYNGDYFDQDYESGGTVTTDQNGVGTATAGWLYATLTYTGTGASSWSSFVAPQFYSSTGGYSGTVSNNPISGASNLYLGQVSGTTSSYPISVEYNFMRARAYPPNGAMPSTSFGTTSLGTGSPTSVTDSLGDSFTLSVSQSALSGSTLYESEIWYATASSSGSDTITATFNAAVTGSVSIYEITGYSTSGVLYSSGSSTAGSTAASVSSFTPSSNSFAVGNVETGSTSTRYTVGSGYTTVASGSGGCDASDASQGCGEYELGLGSATTTPFTLSASTPWADVAASFAPLTSITYYSYIYYATAASSGADTITASFGSTVAGSVSIYEISGVTATGLLTSTGSSASAQSTTSVSSVTPTLAASVVIGNSETPATTYTAGSGYTLSGSCSTVTGCGEYQTGVGTATTVPMSISPSEPWVEAAVIFAPIITNYYSYFWYATVGTSGSDTITTAFGSTVAASVSIYEITGYTISGALSSTGSSSTGSTTAAVTSYTPATDSFIVGNAEGASGTTTFTATSGFTLGGTCSSVGGCSEYDASNSDGGAANTVPITLGASTPWVEASMSFSTPFNPQSGIQVGGYPTMGVPSGADIVWEVTFTNVDPLHRAITIWPQTEMAIGSAEFDGFDIDYQQAHYYLISGLNSGSTTVNAYSTSAFITLAYNIPTTLYFASTAALGSTTQAFGTNVLTPFEAYFALSGIMSDGTLFGETIPYPYGIITDANAYTTPTAGSTGATVTVSCTSPCDFTDSAKAAVGWLNSAGQMTALTTFTMTGSGNIPSGVTFQVPTATAGYYTIVVTDYTNSVFMTFQHT